MATDFPTGIDAKARPTATDKMNAVGVEGDVVVDNLYDAVEAIEAKLGVNGSAVTTSHDYKLSGVTGTDKVVSRTGEETLTTKTLTTPVIASIYQDAAKTKLMTLPNTANDTLTANAATQTLTNKTLTTPRINTPQFNEAVNMTATSTEVNTTIGANATEKILNTKPKAYAYLSGDQLNITNSTFTKVAFNTELFDVGSDFDTTNNRFVAPITGYYLVCSHVDWVAGTIGDQKQVISAIYVNGSIYGKTYSMNHSSGTTLSIGVFLSSIIYMAASQYVELYAFHTHGDNTPDIEADGTFMSVHLLSV